MISQTTILILGGCLLGAVQLIAGILIGLWIRQSGAGNAKRHQHDMLQARRIAQRLKALADEMSNSASAHRTELDEASQLLQTSEARSDEALAEMVVDVIGDILRANQNLESQLSTAESRLKAQALEIEAHISRSLTDTLTGLPNRREFNERLEERMSAWKRRKEVFSLLLLDVDHFKALNDQHGHLVGDQVLVMTGNSLRTSVRRQDAVARYGGEEFAILLPNTAVEQAWHVAENVRETVGKQVIDQSGQRIIVTASGGLAMIEPGDTAETLIEKADAALYAAKASGRNRTCIHSGDVDTPDPPSRIAKRIHETDADKYSGILSANFDPAVFGTYLERDEISAALAQTCEELRRVAEERAKRSASATPVTEA